MSKASNGAKRKLASKRYKTRKAQPRQSHYGNAVAASSWSERELSGLRWTIDLLRQAGKKTVRVEHVCPKCGERSEVETEIELDDLRAAADFLSEILAGVGTGASRWFQRGG